jgi:hypothetical protein
MTSPYQPLCPFSATSNHEFYRATVISRSERFGGWCGIPKLEEVVGFKFRVLVVDDDPPVLQVAQALFASKGYEVLTG